MFKTIAIVAVVLIVALLCNSKLMPFNVTHMVYGLKVLIDV